jgi:aspartyl-tRNA(Asn)/glutamyl-tRNA(Gln) amidotransferase subunit C
MSGLSKDEVKHVAKLSNLSLNNDEISTYQKQLSEVISYIEELKEVDVEGVEPTSQTTGLVNVNRSDEVNPLRILSQEDATSQANESHNGYFVVPAVITKEHDDR